MRTVQDRLAGRDLDATPVSLVTISFDPERDTPAALQAYARAAGADPNRWRFATGDPARIKDIIGGGFEAYYEPDGQAGFKFAPAFFLADGWGIIRAEYRNETPDPERILKHIEVVEEEVRNSKGVAKVAYEAAHLFLCYARWGQEGYDEITLTSCTHHPGRDRGADRGQLAGVHVAAALPLSRAGAAIAEAGG
jgi:protein SCO1/2